jgi:hypothetical protein
VHQSDNKVTNNNDARRKLEIEIEKPLVVQGICRLLWKQSLSPCSQKPTNLVQDCFYISQHVRYYSLVLLTPCHSIRLEDHAFSILFYTSSNSCRNDVPRFLKIKPKFCLSHITAITHSFYFDLDEV